MTELEKRSLEIAQANADKEQLEDKIKNLEEQLVSTYISPSLYTF